MKYLVIITLCASLISCSQTATPPAANITTTPDSSVTSIDAVSGATNSSAPLSLNGVLSIPPQSNITISLPINGIISSFTLMPGTYVQKGQTIAVLENTEFVDMQQSYLDASAQSEFLEAEYNRQQTLADHDVTSQKRLQQSKAEFLSAQSRKQATGAKLSMLGVDHKELIKNGIVGKLTITAPSSGYVSDIMVNQGKFISAGDPICQIINKSQILLNLIAYEKDLQSLTIGQQISFRANGIEDQEFRAVITAIDQRVDLINRSVKVYAKSSGTHPNFRPGVYVTATI